MVLAMTPDPPIEVDDTGTDHALMVAIQAGDEVAFRKLWDRWREPLFRFLLRRTGGQSRAEDALQQTWIKVWRYRSSFDTARPFRTWIFKICAHAGRDAWRADVKMWRPYSGSEPQIANSVDLERDEDTGYGGRLHERGLWCSPGPTTG